MTVKLYRVSSGFVNVPDQIVTSRPGGDCIYYENEYELPQGYTLGETESRRQAIFDPSGKYCDVCVGGKHTNVVLLVTEDGITAMKLDANPAEMKIRDRRQNAGLTQQQLASAVGATQKQISAWETGQNEPSIKVLKAMAQALDCKIDDLV